MKSAIKPSYSWALFVNYGHPSSHITSNLSYKNRHYTSSQQPSEKATKLLCTILLILTLNTHVYHRTNKKLQRTKTAARNALLIEVWEGARSRCLRQVTLLNSTEKPSLQWSVTSDQRYQQQPWTVSHWNEAPYQKSILVWNSIKHNITLNPVSVFIIFLRRACFRFASQSK